MIESSKKNIDFIEETFHIHAEKKIIFEHDATKIHEANIFKTEKIDAIVSE
jgi:hypothetical protein